MNINIESAHAINFKIEYFSPTEGGMDNQQYGQDCSTLEEALDTLLLARKSSKDEWLIVELTNKCARKLHMNPDSDMLLSECKQVIESIFKELNLESLLKDKMMLDFLLKHGGAKYWDAIEGYMSFKDREHIQQIQQAIESEGKV